MRMEQSLNAHRYGAIKGLNAEVGVSVAAGAQSAAPWTEQTGR
jgi:Acetyl/propionyl-CoA carboxylase, alpha subunit